MLHFNLRHVYNRSCGPLELILNTPSHHRMHHRPPGNCNYAGVLIIWDRVFGTFQAEDRQIRSYGLAKPLQSYNPVLANFEHWHRMLTKECSGPEQLLKRRCRHSITFIPTNIFRFQSRAITSLWSVEDRDEVEKRGKGDGIFRVPMYSGAEIKSLFMMMHICLHWVLTFTLGFFIMSKREELAWFFFILFFWCTWSFSSIGNLCSSLHESNLTSETTRVAVLVIGLFNVNHWWFLAAMVVGYPLQIPTFHSKILGIFISLLWYFALPLKRQRDEVRQVN